MSIRIATDWTARLALRDPAFPLTVFVGIPEVEVKFAAGWHVDGGVIAGRPWTRSAWEQWAAVERAGGFDPDVVYLWDPPRRDAEMAASQEKHDRLVGEPAVLEVSLDAITRLHQDRSVSRPPVVLAQPDNEAAEGR